MATVNPQAIGPAVLGASPAAVYTSSVNTVTVITRASVNNVAASAAKLKVWVVRSGGSEADGNLVVGASASGLTVAVGPTTPMILDALAGLVLQAGDAVWAESDTASALIFTASGFTQ